MDPADVLKYLKLMPMFQSLDEDGEEDLFRLVPHVQEHIYDEGRFLFHVDEVPDRTTLILDGVVEINSVADNGLELNLGTKSTGEVIGRQSLDIADFEYNDVKAQGEVRVLDIPFRDLVKAYQNSDTLRSQLSGTLSPVPLVETLKTIPLFENCDDEDGELELFRLTPIVHEQVYDNREWLFRQGEISDRIMLLLEGQVRLDLVGPDGASRRVGTVIPGDTIGVTGFLVGDYHDVTAVAEGYARILYILREDFGPFINERPGLRARLVISKEIESRMRLREFDWLRPDEWVIMIIQRHWTMLARTITPALFLLAVLVPVMVTLLFSEGLTNTIFGFVLMFPVLGCLGLIGYQYINWRDDYFVITTQRVLHTERAWPVSTKDEETSLDNIEDIYDIRSGIAANVLNYGNLVLQTAGETVQIDMNYIPAPDAARKVISAQIERFKARELLHAQGHIRDLLKNRLIESDHVDSDKSDEELDESRDKNIILALLSALWYYLFPPSWSETKGAGTIVWRRFWLPGFSRSIAVFLILVGVTISGAWFFITYMRNENIGVWFVAWLIGEVILGVILLWFIEDWRNDYFQMTWNHIIQVDRRPMLLQESRREARLDRIQNLSFEVPGIIARIFNYGHVTFETAGTEGKFELRWVRNPAKVKNAISDRQYEYNKKLRQMGAQQRQQELLNWFTIYHEFQRDSNTNQR